MGLVSLLMAFSVNTVAAQQPILSSAYPSGTDPQKAFAACQEVSYQEESGVSLVHCPVMAEAKDYTIAVALHEHGAHLSLLYQGREVVEGLQQSEWPGLVHIYGEPNFEVEAPWFMSGVQNGVFEFRYELRKGIKVPFALIYRDNFYELGQNIWTGVERLWTQKSALVVISLRGEQSRIVGVIDSAKAKAKGLSANHLARQCADSLLGAGDPTACSEASHLAQGL